MSGQPQTGPVHDNRRRTVRILVVAILSTLVYLGLALAGDLRERLALLWIAHAALLGGMLAAWWSARGAGAGPLRLALAAALAFRLVAVLGEPSLSDDVHRYVWDGRVQAHGVHPYRLAPLDPELEALRDDSWAQINHPELPTIYPPLAQAVFLLVATPGAGPTGFRLAFGLADFGVVLVLGALLRRRRAPPERVLLYAWNPLAVLEVAGSGHVEPLGAGLLLLALLALGAGRAARAGAALAAAIQIKLLPAILIPTWAGRLRARGGAALLLVLAVTWLPYALTGPAVGGGTFEYAGRWEHNAPIYPAVAGLFEALDLAPWLKRGIAAAQQRLGDSCISWDFLYRHVWPGDLARLTLAGLALAWAVGVGARVSDPVRQALLVLGGLLLLSPTVHPWYLLWVLPLAAALSAWPWLLLAALVPLAYATGATDVPWALRGIEYLAPALLALMLARRRGSASSGPPQLG